MTRRAADFDEDGIGLLAIPAPSLDGSSVGIAVSWHHQAASCLSIWMF
jgi:hypothetical protein